MEARCMVPMKASSEAVTIMLLGSGVRFIGALAAIEEKGLKVKRIVGASAGSIIGSIYASGMLLPEMKKSPWRSTRRCSEISAL